METEREKEKERDEWIMEEIIASSAVTLKSRLKNFPGRNYSATVKRVWPFDVFF